MMGTVRLLITTEIATQTFREQAESLGVYLPRILGAFGLLVAGWVTALFLGALVRSAVRRTGIGSRAAEWLPEGATGEEPARVVGKAIYYLAMLFVIVGFFQVLGLDLITEPLNALLSQLLLFAPRILGASALLLAAWIVATVLRGLLSTVFTGGRMESSVQSMIGESEGGSTAVGVALGNAVYWLTLLIFLPAVLGTLAVEGLLAPVRGIVDQVLGFLPNLFAAALLLAIGWVAARLVRTVMSNVLAAVGADALADRVGVGEALGPRKLSELLGLVAYVFVLIPVVIGSLQALQLQAVTAPASEMLARILGALPAVFAAAFLLGLAYLVARLVGGLTTSVLAGAGADGIPERLGLAPPEGERFALSSVLGTVAVVAIMLFATVEAASLIGFTTLAGLVSRLLVFAGQIAVGLVILALGLMLGNLASRAVTATGWPQAGLLGTSARVAVVVLAAAMALGQMGVAGDIINITFALVIGAIAVALALAFGLGARELAGELAREWSASLRGKRGRTQTTEPIG